MIIKFFRNIPCPVEIMGNYIGFSDLDVSLHGIDLKDVRHKIRDEKRQITYVYDRLLGFTVDNCE